MTARLLASFNVLDDYSKKVLDRHARKNLLLSGSCQQPELPLSQDLDWDFPSARRTPISKPKTNAEIISEEQELLHNKLRCFMSRTSKFTAPTQSVREDSSCRPENAVSSIVSVRPFSSHEDLSWRTGQRTGQDEDSEGIMVIKSPSFKSGKHPSQRPKWSRELEKVPPLELDSDNSKAMVGGALGYTDTSHWCSSPSPRDTLLTAFTEEEEDQFSLSESVGKVVGQQLQRGNIVRVCTSRAPRRSRESPVRDAQREEQSPSEEEAAAESVPLSLTDELERESVKVLTPRPASVYAPLPIVSETYPVVCNTEPHRHQPFTSPGFHSLGRSEHSAPRRIKVHSAIVRITDSLQAEIAVRKRRERETEERRGPWARIRSMSLRALSADGGVTKDTDLGRLPLQPPPSPAAPPLTSRGTHLVPLTAPPGQKRGSSDAAWTVLNGMNPKQANTRVSPSKYFRPLPTGMRKQPTVPPTPPNSHREPVTSCSSKKDFLFISKPLLVTKLVAKQRHHKDWCAGQRQVCNDYAMSKAADLENIGAHGVSFLSRHRRRTESRAGCAELGRPLPSPYLSDQESERSDRDVSVGIGTDCTLKTICPFDPQAINIPTA